MPDKDKLPTEIKPVSLEDIALNAYKNKDKVPASFSPGLATEFDFEKKSTELGAAFHPELGSNAVNQLSEQFAKDKAYSEAKKKADDQGIIGESWGALYQTVIGEVLGGGLDAVGTMLDFDQISNLEEGSTSLGLMLSEAGKGLREHAQEFAPIYQDPGEEGEFRPWDHEWWFSNIPSVASALSIMIPVAGEAKVLSLLGEGASAIRGAATLGKFGKSAKSVAKVLDNLVDVTKATLPELSYAERLSVKGLHRATVSTHIEATMEATGTFDEEYKKLKATGMDDVQARTLAAESASFVYKANWANLATEFMQQMLLLKAGPTLTSNIGNMAEAEAIGASKAAGIMGSAKKYSKNFLAEGLEEGYQFVVQEEGKYLADVKAGLTQEEDFSERLSKYATKGELWTSAFMGGFGGVAFQKYGTKLVDKVQSKFLGKTEQLTQQQLRLQDLQTQSTRAMDAVVTVNEAYKTGNPKVIKAARQNLALSMGITAAQNETLDYALDRFENMKNMSKEQRDKAKFSEDYINEIEEHKKNITLAATLYAENTQKYGPGIAESITNTEFSLNKYIEQQPEVKKNYDDLVTKLPNYVTTSINGRKLIDKQVTISGYEKQAKLLDIRLKQGEMTASAKIKTQEDLANIYDALNIARTDYETFYDEVYKELSKQDNVALKSLEGKYGEALINSRFENLEYDRQIENLTNRLNFLTSKKGQEALNELISKTSAYNKAVNDDKEIKTALEEQEEDLNFSEEETTVTSLDSYNAKIASGELKEEDLDPELRTALADWNATKAQKQENKFDEGEQGATDFYPKVNNERTVEDKVEQKAVVSNAINIQEVETPVNEDSAFGDPIENINLSTVSALAWKSSSNTQASLQDKTSEKNKTISNYLENPDIDLKGVEIRFEVNLDYLKDYRKNYNDPKSEGSIYHDIREALNKKVMPENVGRVPVLAKFFKDGKQIEYNGHKIEVTIHDDTYSNYDASIKEAAKAQIREQKTQIVKGFFEGKTLISKVTNKSNGFILTSRTNEKDFSRNPLLGAKESLFQKVEDVHFIGASNNEFVDPITKEVAFDVIGTKADNGAIYVKLKTANGNTFPLRLQVDKISNAEAELIYSLYEEVLANDKSYLQNISPDIIKRIEESTDPRIKELGSFLKLNNTTIAQLLDTLVYNGQGKTTKLNTEGKREKTTSTLYVAKGDASKNKKAALVLGKSLSITLDKLAENKATIIERLTTARRRQVSLKGLQDKAYREYLIKNSILTTNAYPNESGRAFVQPRIDYNPEFEVLQEKIIINTSSNIIDKNIRIKNLEVKQTINSKGNIEREIKNLDNNKSLLNVITKEGKSLFFSLPNLNSLIDNKDNTIKEVLGDININEELSILESQKIVSSVKVTPIQMNAFEKSEEVKNIEEVSADPKIYGEEEFGGFTDFSRATPLVETVSEKVNTPEEINKVTTTSNDERARRKAIAEKLKKEKRNDEAFKLLDINDVKNQNKSLLLDGNEINRIIKMLPKEIGVKLQNDYVKILNNGMVATGLFVDNMIHLSRKADVGTGYHEAFHAIFRSSLSDKEINSLYKEAAKTYLSPTTEDINKLQELYKIDQIEAMKLYYEEMMADDFMDFMLSESRQSPREYSKGIKGFFEKLIDWINHVFTNRLTTKKLFKDIAQNKYKNKPVNIKRGVAYKAIIKVSTTGNTYEANEIKDITQQLAYVVLNRPNYEDEPKVSDKISNYLISYADKLEESEQQELADRTHKVLDDLSYFTEKVKDYIVSLGIENEDFSEDESGNLMYTPSYETSAKQSAGKDIKLLIALTPKFNSFNIKNTVNKDYDLDSYLGLPKFENFGETFNKIITNLHGTTPIYKDGVLTDSFELMLDKLTILSKYHPSIGYIRNKLVGSNTHVKNQFHFVFSNMKGNYKDALISGVPGVMNYRLSSSDTMSKPKEIATIWSNQMVKKLGIWDSNYGGVIYNQDTLKALTEMHIALLSSIQKDRLNKSLSDQTRTLLRAELSSIGVEMSDMSFEKMITSQEYVKGLSDELRELNQVNNLYLKLDNALKSTASYKGLIRVFKGAVPFPAKEGLITDKTNHILDQRLFHEELAGYEAEFAKSPGDSSIPSAGGTNKYIYQDNNLMSKLIAEINAGDTSHLDKIKTSPYNTNSLFIEKLLSNEQTRKDFKITLYNNYKNTDDSDKGDKAKDLKEADKHNDVINKYLSGTLVGLAEADKSQQYYIEGFELENSQITTDAQGKIITTSNNAVNILTNYFIAEVNRMKTIYEQKYTKKLPIEEQILYLHYNLDKDGNPTKEGNWINSYLFPNMNLEEMGIIVKSKADPSKLMGVVPYDNLTKDQQNAIKEYIHDKFIKMVENDLQELTKYNILKQEGTTYKNQTLDISKINTKYDGDVVAAVGDYTLNSIITNVEMTKLFTQDPALYKRKGDGFEDFRKRIPAIIASGKDQRIFDDGTYKVRQFYNSAVIENIISPSEYFLNEDNIKTISIATGKSEAEVRKMFDAYLEVNETDAQAWITIDLYRERMIGFGKWNDDVLEPAYKRIKDGKESLTDKALFAQPLKTIHAEVKTISGISTMQYNKQSEAVLLPSVAKQLKIDNLLQSMIANKVDHVITLDGKKVGATNVAKVRKEDKTWLEAKDIKLIPQALDNRYLFLQQDLPHKGVKDTLVGSQAVKNVLSMLKMTETYDGLTGAEIYKEYNEVISKLSNLGLIEIKHKLGYDVNGNITDKTELNKTFVREIKDSVSENIVQGLQNGISLDVLVQIKNKIQNKTAAMITKKTTKLKQNGGSMIQTSSFGYSSDDIKLSDPVKGGIIWFKNPSEELQPSRLIEKNSLNKEEISIFVELREDLLNSKKLSKEQIELMKDLNINELSQTQENLGKLIEIHCK